MKIYISADIEGTADVFTWEEVVPGSEEYRKACRQMTAEVAAACAGANKAGAAEIWVHDAHLHGKNIAHESLPDNTILVRGFSGHPYSMLQELNESFDAVILLGCHSEAGSGANPLSHTITRRIHRLHINGTPASEMMLSMYTAASLRVPVVLVSGDQAVCDVCREISPHTATVATKSGHGDSVLCSHPDRVCRSIADETEAVLKKNLPRGQRELPGEFRVEVEFKDHGAAYRASFYPDIETSAPTTVVYKTKDFFEVLRMLHFVLKA
jgi:D-amino peptidase